MGLGVGLWECIFYTASPFERERERKKKRNSDELCGRTGSPWSTAHHHPNPSRRDRWGIGGGAHPGRPPLWLQARRGGPDGRTTTSAAPHAARVRVSARMWWPLSWRRDGRVPRPRPRASVSRRAVVFGSLPGTESRDIGPALAPMPRPVRAGFYSVSEHSPPRADLDASSAARRRPLLLVGVAVGCVACCLALFSSKKFYKIFQIFCHIESLEVCMEY